MRVWIYQEAKRAQQSGLARTKNWVLEPEQVTARQREPLMGWTSAADTLNQLRLSFPSKEAAIAYAERNGLDYNVEAEPVRKFKPKSYSDNFRHDRKQAWTH